MPDADTGASVRDSAGVWIVEHTADIEPELEEWQLEPVLRIGGAEAEGAAAFHLVQGAVRLPDGRLAVADGGSLEIRYFAADGGSLFRVGGEGSGPGEFLMIEQVASGGGDTLLVRDWRAGRITVLAGEGEVVSTLRVPAEAPGIRPLGRLEGRGWLLDWIRDSNTSPWAQRETVTLVAWDGVNRPDSLFAFSVPERSAVREERPGGTVAVIGTDLNPLAPRAFAVAFGEEWVLAPQESAELRIHRPPNGLVGVIRTGAEPVPYSPEHLKTRFGFEELPLLHRSFREPEHLPAYGQVLHDGERRLWVEEFRVEPGVPRRWTVYGARGEAVAAVVVPPGLRILSIADRYLVAHERDEVGAEVVRVFRAERAR